MVHLLPNLPYSKSALAPAISEETLEFHYGKHHNTYVTNLNKLIAGTEFESLTLEQICGKAAGPIFNNAAQHWNHSFYWQCLTPQANQPTGALAAAISADFGSPAQLKEKFAASAVGNFGSGWTWIVKKDGHLSIENTGNAAMPQQTGKKPILVCDVWEHAYYIDYRNNRAAYVEAFWKIVNWKFVESQFGAV
ncbi:MAG TPA: superoxide dismutase [Chitinivibrionales bacterium]